MGALLIVLLVTIVFIPTWTLIQRVDHAFLRQLVAFLYILMTFFALNLAFIMLINHFFDLIIVTDCRMIIVRKTLYLRNDHDMIDLIKIQDIGVESRGILCNYLDYGKLVISLSSVGTPIVIEYAPFPHEILERANRIKRIHIVDRQEKRKLLSQDAKKDTVETSELALNH